MYYYYYDANGKKVEKSCGTDVKSRRAAEEYVQTLPPPKMTIAKIGDLSVPPRIDRQDMLVGDIAREMFLPGSAHVNRRAQLKNPLLTKQSATTEHSCGT